MTTISDVAKKAGVSVATVSRVLNNSTPVKPDTAEKVRQYIDELSYVPNLSARNLRKNESRVLLILAPNFSNPYYSQILSGIGDEAKTCGYSVLICKTDGDQQEEANIMKMLVNRRADGAILLANTNQNAWISPFIGKYPIVECCEYGDSFHLPHISIDNYQAAYDTIQYLCSLGHTRIGMVSSSNGYISTKLRYEGYLNALRANGIAPDDALVAYASGDYSLSSGYNAGKELLSLSDRPTALFCVSDILALGSVSAAVDMGLSVPGDVSVTGFDDCDYTTIVHPHLTTIAQPCYELGRQSMRTLDAMMESKKYLTAENACFLPYQLIERESTGIRKQ